ncbi:MAG: hypothetical protein R2850_13430 [Bacteroidia bacterium]
MLPKLTIMIKSISLSILILLSSGVYAQKNTKKKKNEDDKKEWDCSVPPGPFKTVNLELTEGTWMNLDVSPDGKSIVFDILGDIYQMPYSGGEATLLRGGHPYEVQPRYSPNGKWISFTSDAGGADNIWVMKTDGSEARQVTKEDFRLLNNAVWSPDGNYLIARKHFTSTRSAGAGEMWMYHISGGTLVATHQKKNDSRMQVSLLFRRMEIICIILKMFIREVIFNIIKTRIVRFT